MNRMMQRIPLSAGFESGGLPAAQQVSFPQTRGTIVIAEDDVVTLRLLCRVLTRANFTVHAYENGQAACDAVRREAPDVVLLDWMMPVMDGPTAVGHLKANLRTREIPVVMLTTQSNIEERVVALGTGIQDFMTKPFDARELVARIDQQIHWRKLLAKDDAGAAENPETMPGPAYFERMWGESPKPPRLRPKK